MTGRLRDCTDATPSPNRALPAGRRRRRRASWPGPAAALTIHVDYSLDEAGNNFFGSGNPQGSMAGSQARTAMNAAAAFYSGILKDTFTAIQTPPTFFGSLGGTASLVLAADLYQPRDRFAERRAESFHRGQRVCRPRRRPQFIGE